MEKKADVIIGIYPDASRSGIAMLAQCRKKFKAASLRFWTLINNLKSLESECEKLELTMMVVIDGGWLDDSNWNITRYDTKTSAAAKGRAVGRNHEVGLLIADYCEYYNIPYEVVRPLKKMWKGKDGKITHKELAAFTSIENTRTNQEERDAALLAWTYAGLPIRVRL